MKSDTPKKKDKRTFESVVNASSTLRLQTREDSSPKTDKTKQSSLEERFSVELVSRVVECIREL
ncbi:MAG: hypothetical protein DRI56_05095 [Chloroflexota bacterium]|nr:MAG: hypothetical protein DRI56_05095 [Chloroflexota bacterium]